MKVKVIKAGLPSYWYADKIGGVFDVIKFDGSSATWDYKLVSDQPWGSYFDKDDVELVSEEKQMKADDKISVEFTGKQLAKLYAMSGKYNGPSDSSVFNILRDLLDPMQKKYNKMLLVKDPIAASNYCGYVDAWEELLFREEKTPAQVEMESLQTKIEELTKQAEKLQNIINK